MLILLTENYVNAQNILNVSDEPDRTTLSIFYGKIGDEFILPQDSSLQNVSTSLYGVEVSFCVVACSSLFNPNIELGIGGHIGKRKYIRDVPLVGGGTAKSFRSENAMMFSLGLRQNIYRFNASVGTGVLFGFEDYSYDKNVVGGGSRNNGGFVFYYFGGGVEVLDYLHVSLKKILINREPFSIAGEDISSEFGYYSGWEGVIFQISGSVR